MIGEAIAAIGRVFSKPDEPAPTLKLVADNSADPIEPARADPGIDLLHELRTIVAASEGIAAMAEECLRADAAALDTSERELANAERAHTDAAAAFEREDTDEHAYALSVTRERVPRATQRLSAARAKRDEAEQTVTAAQAAVTRGKSQIDRFEKLTAIAPDKFHETVAPMAAKMLAALDEADLWAGQIDLEFWRVNRIATEIGETPLSVEHLVIEPLRILATTRGVFVPPRVWRLIRVALTRPLVADVSDQLTDSHPRALPSTPQMWTPSLAEGISRGGLAGLLLSLRRFASLDEDRRTVTRSDLDLLAENRGASSSGIPVGDLIYETNRVEDRNVSKRNDEERARELKEERERSARLEADAARNFAREQRTLAKAPRNSWSMTDNPDEGWNKT